MPRLATPALPLIRSGKFKRRSGGRGSPAVICVTRNHSDDRRADANGQTPPLRMYSRCARPDTTSPVFNWTGRARVQGKTTLLTSAIIVADVVPPNVGASTQHAAEKSREIPFGPGIADHAFDLPGGDVE